ncbi:cytochrome b561/polyisoprenoid-binding protein YceI [Sulfitobacter undariae]|uniref:Cytochrome b561/polyisoprenoid-binding protein YceI n=1 Tax=Sulfitobacter undariae TaxID=1563671 RepID=A0A7W6EAM3_9RHOB|nr:cytochrome b/b6 domain-containing protein [Sulfitobacter undariae]MBB3994708.1 cytochrome b561/polyisoprenoid-binding protein YceI [Sulfitobacter undariae]
MARSNTNTTYGSVTRCFHWLTALLILTLIPVGIMAADMPFDTSEQLTRKAWLFSLHKTLGIGVFLVALLRILWAMTQTKPAPLHPKRKLETLAAETVHWLLYSSLVLVPLSGWVHHAATTGFAPIWWPLGQDLPMVPKSETVAAFAGGVHWVFGKVMIISLILHIAGALKHQVVDKDATLRRMINGAPDLGHLPAARHSATPFFAAIALWAIALAAGGSFGVYGSHSTAPTVQSAQLAAVSSDWTVQTGTISIGVTQFGSVVQGSFNDWTANISYDPEITQGTAGMVEVTIAIGSLTLGSVTDQAMGPDYFDATQFQTAIFKADIIAADGLIAQGTLTLKGQTMPLSFPFTLTTDAQSTRMQADLALDRRSFGIGDNMADESSLGFNVGVTIDLTASRTPAE